MNSCHQVFKKLVLGTTLMCCAGMSTVEAGPWDWLKNLFAGGEIAKLSKDVVRLERKVKGLERSNKVKTCIIVTSVAGCVVAGCYCFFKKRPGTAENAIQDGETPISLQQEEETPVLALEEEQGETQVQDLNTAENETRIENEAPVQPRVGLVVSEAQDFALCIENVEKENRACKNCALLVNQLTEVGKAIGNDVALLGGQGVSQSVENLIAINKNLSETVKNDSETMKSQQETIRDLVRIVQNGEIIMLQILDMCKGSFDANSVAGYSVNNTARLDTENENFIKTERGKELAIIIQKQDNSETIVAVRNAEKSLCVLQQCLQGVEVLNRQKEKATQEVKSLSESNEFLQQEKEAAKQAAVKAEETVTQIRTEKESLAMVNESLRKANNDINEKVEALEQKTNEVAKENKQLAEKARQAEQQKAKVEEEIAIVRANSVDRAKILQRVRSSEAQGIIRKFEKYL